MVGLFILGGLIISGIGAYIFFKIKWSRESGTESRVRSAKIARETEESAAARAEAGSD
ncbi:MAG: hypothetical protein Q8Q07_07260 [Dehalococcoidales bacterium]|nr:hypothetical protein [Dehalococcoidales bacterium]MDZ4231114.1 hypothetical protein [Dehalococcoidales bacterium]